MRSLRVVTPGRPAALDTAMAVTLAVVSVVLVLVAPAAGGDLQTPVTLVLVLASTLPLAFRRRWPVAVGLLMALVVLAGSAAGANLALGGIGLLVAVYTIATCSARRTSLLVLVSIPVFLLLADLLYALARPSPFASLAAGFAANVTVFVLVWAAGDAVKSRRQYVAILEERTRRLEDEKEELTREAVRNERLLIARELHDVVAHGVSVMVVHAGAARRVIDERPEQARDALQTIETTGREALVELRRLVGILRADGAAPPLDPQQGLDGLGALIASVGSAGVPVELAVEGEPRPLPAGVDLAAYRIVQEALTNTIKHAGHARARVRVAYEGAALDLEIVDDGRSRVPDGGRRAIAPPGQGHGLIGMRERVHLYGGDFEAGPRQGGGFRVRARLPLEGAPG